MGDNLKSWDAKFPQVEFSHNMAVNHRVPLLFAPIPDDLCVHGVASGFIADNLKIHQLVHSNLIAASCAYKAAADKGRRKVIFEVGDFVWAVFTKDPFPPHEYDKLAACKVGPVEILERINPNAYRLALPSHLHTSDIFNVKHLIPYVGDTSSNDDSADSRVNLPNPVGDDVDQIPLAYMERLDRKKAA